MCAMRWPRNFACECAIFMLAAAAICAVYAASMQADARSLATKLHVSRTSPSDLEVSGDIAGVASGETRFLTREDLLVVSQAMTIRPGDGNYTVPAQVKAVPLEDLTSDAGRAGG